MPTVIAAHGAVLDRALDAIHRTFRAGLNRQAYGKFYAARMKTSRAGRYQRTFARSPLGSVRSCTARIFGDRGLIVGQPVAV